MRWSRANHIWEPAEMRLPAVCKDLRRKRAFLTWVSPKSRSRDKDLGAGSLFGRRSEEAQ